MFCSAMPYRLDPRAIESGFKWLSLREVLFVLAKSLRVDAKFAIAQFGEALLQGRELLRYARAHRRGIPRLAGSRPSGRHPIDPTWRDASPSCPHRLVTLQGSSCAAVSDPSGGGYDLRRYRSGTAT